MLSAAAFLTSSARVSAFAPTTRAFTRSAVRMMAGNPKGERGLTLYTHNV